MNETPYAPPQTAPEPQRTRSTRWLVWSGAGCFGLAALCFAATIVKMVLGFQSIAQSSQPAPADLANKISLAMLPFYAIGPLLILGIVLLVMGLTIRRPVEKEE